MAPGSKIDNGCVLPFAPLIKHAARAPHAFDHDADRQDNFQVRPDDVHEAAANFVVGHLFHEDGPVLGHTRLLCLRKSSGSLTQINCNRLIAFEFERFRLFFENPSLHGDVPMSGGEATRFSNGRVAKLWRRG
jgi:hypothetical protein